MCHLSDKLSEMYNDAPKNEVVVMVHLFGIVYFEEIQKSEDGLARIVKDSGIHPSLKTEIRKGMNLAKYVQLKPKYRNQF